MTPDGYTGRAGYRNRLASDYPPPGVRAIQRAFLPLSPLMNNYL